jgi:hypothetical protein
MIPIQLANLPTTTQVADLLGVPYWRLTDMLRARKIPAPAKDESGRYRWGEQDVAAARQVFASRSRPTGSLVAGGPVHAA